MAMPALEQGRLWPVGPLLPLLLASGSTADRKKTAVFDVRRLLIVELKHVVGVVKG